MVKFAGLAISGSTPALRRSVRHLLHLIFTLEKAPYDTRLNVRFVSLAHMRQLSRKYKGADRPTDVLTFTAASEASSLVNDLLFGDGPHAALAHSPRGPATASAAPQLVVPPSRVRAELVDLGDIFVSLDYMQQRSLAAASSRSLPIVPYLEAALVHATLHAFGYDHTSPDLLHNMARREQQLGRQLATIARKNPFVLPPYELWDL